MNNTEPPEGAPEAMQHYFRMWNEIDLNKIRGHLDKSVSTDCDWTDPQNSHVGRNALEKNVKEFRTNFPTATLGICSHLDQHHGRYRYDWMIDVEGEVLLQGFDVTTLNAAGLIERVDGFFGKLKPRA